MAEKLVGIICRAILSSAEENTRADSFTFLDGLFPLTSYKDLEKEVHKIAAAKVSEAMVSSPVTVARRRLWKMLRRSWSGTISTQYPS